MQNTNRPYTSRPQAGNSRHKQDTTGAVMCQVCQWTPSDRHCMTRSATTVTYCDKGECADSCDKMRGVKASRWSDVSPYAAHLLLVADR